MRGHNAMWVRFSPNPPTGTNMYHVQQVLRPRHKKTLALESLFRYGLLIF
jgi:hypothetical protein